MTPFATALFSTYNYADLLTPSDVPSQQYYPNLTPSLAAQIVAFLNTVEPIFEQIGSNSTFPLSISYGQILQWIPQAQSLAQQVDQINPYPLFLASELHDVSQALEVFSLYPELFAV